MAVEPIVFSQLAMESSFTDALNAMNQEPALEVFGSFLSAKNAAREKPKFSMVKLQDQSAAAMVKTIQSFYKALVYWQHQFSIEFNDALKYIMNFNSDTIKLCNADLKRLQKRSSDLKKAMKERGLPSEQYDQIHTELLNVDGMLDDLKKRIKSLGVSLYLPESMAVALNEAMTSGSTLFKMTFDLYDKYEKCIDALEDKADFRYGMKTEKLVSEMEAIAAELDNGSQFRKMMDEKIAGLNRIIQTKIYGQSSTVDNGTGIEVATQDAIGRPLIKTYDKVMALLDKSKKRLKELEKLCQDYRQGEAPNEPLTMIVSEVVFTMHYLVLTSELMMMYFSAPLSIAKASSVEK